MKLGNPFGRLTATFHSAVYKITHLRKPKVTPPSPANDNPELALIAAVKSGQKDRVSDLIDKGVDVHASQEAPLRAAITGFKTEIAFLLIHKGANHAAAAAYISTGGNKQEKNALEAWRKKHKDFLKKTGSVALARP